ncbi:hypothetical protein PHMEG_00033318 [Phytophthora megakarya]|uniref:Uncharacterized protein n=1 Tax=Phytophthora megakarya TaxID=4795 RepID=A0A225UTW9_9STRA|nr:hypothetical protein PHMEG_00033318 [Phytophthora megakarya]
MLETPPRYPYVCQPADESWNKPFESGLRYLWVSRLRGQLVERVDSAQREVKRLQLHKAILKVRKDLTQVDADIEVMRPYRRCV